MTSIILNEREFAEAAIETCALGQKPLETIGRVARYYAASGYKRGEICTLLEEFLLKCDPTVNIVKWQTTLDRQAKMASKIGLIELDSIPITGSELSVCGGLQGAQVRRLMFTLICLAKYANAVNPKNSGWVNRQDREIFKLANVVTPVKRQSLMLNDLRELGLIRFSRKVDNVNINVSCLDYADEPQLLISDFRNLGYQYSRWEAIAASTKKQRACSLKTDQPENTYFECEACGIVTRRSNNSQRYCRDCGAEINRQKSRENWRRGVAS